MRRVVANVACPGPRQMRPSSSAFSSLVGLVIGGVRRHGKLAGVEFRARTSGADRPVATVVVHPRMSGSIGLAPPNELPDHLRLCVALEGAPGGAGVLYFRDPRRFGWADLSEGSFADSLAVKRLGPDAMDPHLAFSVFRRAFPRTRLRVKTALLDQTRLAGLGNIYADEVLFAAGIHPATPCVALDECVFRDLWDAMRRILREAIHRQGTSFDTAYRLGSYQAALQVYGRKGDPCPRCRSALTFTRIAQRGTTFCSKCQPLER